MTRGSGDYQTRPGIRAPDITRQIFESHFQRAMSEADYARARAIFEEIGAFNERSIAIQLHVAQHVGRLEEVLAAYEKIAGPDGYLHLVPDPITRATEVRMFGDVIYGSVINEGGNPLDLLRVREEADIPKIFDLMGVE